MSMVNLSQIFYDWSLLLRVATIFCIPIVRIYIFPLSSSTLITLDLRLPGGEKCSSFLISSSFESASLPQFACQEPVGEIQILHTLSCCISFISYTGSEAAGFLEAW